MKTRRCGKPTPMAAVAVAFVSLVFIAPRPAHAVEPVTVGTFLAKSFTLFKEGMALLGGPDLDQVKEEIIAQIWNTRNWELQGRVESIVGRFAENARNPNLMQTPGRIVNFLDDSSDTFYEMQKIIREGDVAQGYHLTSAYNVLSLLRASAMKQLGYEDVSLNKIFSETFTTNYQMVGARKVEHRLVLWPGFWFTDEVAVPLTLNATRTSKLWDSKMFAGRSYGSYWCPYNVAYIHHVGCDLVQETCRRVNNGGGPVPQDTTQACIGPEIERLTGLFDDDTEVQVMRTTLDKLLGMGFNLPAPSKILEI